jgi:ribulose-phosphate 3-epimerase
MTCVDQLGVGKSGTLVSVGVLTSDLQALGNEVARLEQAGAPAIHFDVMDGCFVPDLTFGAAIVAAVRTSLLKDVHLMIQSPLEKLSPFIAAGADILTVQAESCVDIRAVLVRMASLAAERGKVVKRGLALMPDTPINVVEPILADLDYVLLLAITPGLGEQAFRSDTDDRMRAIRELADKHKCNLLVGVDGGITKENVGKVAETGPDILVTGSAIFDGRDPMKNYQTIAQAVHSAEVKRHDQSLVG